MSARVLIGYALAGGIGLLMMGFASMTYFWYGYQQANPAIGSVSTTPGFEFVTAGIFLLGTVIAFLGFTSGLEQVFSAEA